MIVAVNLIVSLYVMPFFFWLFLKSALWLVCHYNRSNMGFFWFMVLGILVGGSGQWLLNQVWYLISTMGHFVHYLFDCASLPFFCYYVKGLLLPFLTFILWVPQFHFCIFHIFVLFLLNFSHLFSSSLIPSSVVSKLFALVCWIHDFNFPSFHLKFCLLLFLICLVNLTHF